MDKLKALFLKIYQPQAHYRIPFSYQRRHTYPIPPYSTFLGFICNVLGVENREDFTNLRRLKLSIAGTLKAKTTEYIWFRNLSKKSHKSRFSSFENRMISGYFEHPGGQIPSLVDVLNDVHLWIYIYHEEENLLREIEKAFRKPVNRLYPLHIGRAEDWVVLNELSYVPLVRKVVGGDFSKFFWIPQKLYGVSNDNWFYRVSGISYKVPVIYTLRNGFRNFTYVEAKLNNGDVSAKDWEMELFFDENELMPVFLLDMERL